MIVPSWIVLPILFTTVIPDIYWLKGTIVNADLHPVQGVAVYAFINEFDSCELLLTKTKDDCKSDKAGRFECCFGFIPGKGLKKVETPEGIKEMVIEGDEKIDSITVLFMKESYTMKRKVIKGNDIKHSNIPLGRVVLDSNP